MFSKTNIYISIIVVIIFFLIVDLCLTRCYGGTYVWQPENLQKISVLGFSPWNMFQTWIITQNDFSSDGRYLYGSSKRGETSPRLEESPRLRGDSKGETECRRVMEEIFNTSFNKSRPDFLNNSVTSTETRSNNLELDCFNEDLRIAVEYNGAQHYKYIPYFHRNKEAFLNQKYRDEMKRSLCEKHNILLIEVPYTVSVQNIESYLLEQLRMYGKI